MEHNTHTGLIRVMAWSGVVLVGSLALSFWLMGFLPPPSPALPAEAIKAIFAILRDHNVPRLMPRWVAMYNFWCALTISPAALIEFFKTGPFTYAGLIDFWFIFAVFFGWMVTMTFVTVRACSRIDAIEASRKDQGVSPAATL